MKPWYTKFGSMAIFQRNLASFEERRLIDTEVLGHGCVNCHAFVWNQPETMTLHVRFPFVMLLARDGKISPIETRTEFNKGPFAYPSWHPNGRMAAYSVNKILQVFHTFGETRDVVDFASDIVLYIADTNTVTTTPRPFRPILLGDLPSLGARWEDVVLLQFPRPRPPMISSVSVKPATISCALALIPKR